MREKVIILVNTYPTYPDMYFELVATADWNIG